jgi:hypothetical protein
MLLNRKTKRAVLGGSSLCVGWLLATSGVQAHPVPALSPDFGSPECITVVDKRTTENMPLEYFVAFDDVAEEPDHIPVPEQKTHQFFAFRGQLTGLDPDYYFWPFDPTLAARVHMPVWIDQGDLLECDAQNTPMIAPQFSPAAIGPNTLTERPELANQWLDVAPTRVPITERQALLGTRWPLADVPAGIYQIIGYIYSPPYNAWEPRPGVIKVIDGTVDYPAVTVSSVDAMLFEGQGRKIGGCLNAPAGTQLRADYRTTATPDAPWQKWAEQPADDTGKFEMCFRSPSPGFSGILEIRVVAISPTGEQIAAYAPDQLVLIPSANTCTESAKLCCDANATQPSAAGAGAAGAAGAPGDMTGTITQGAEMASAGATAMEPAAATPGGTAPPPPSSGCTATRRAPAGTDLWAGLTVLLVVLGLRRRAREL